jgi:hypothetical protein
MANSAAREWRGRLQVFAEKNIALSPEKSRSLWPEVVLSVSFHGADHILGNTSG